MLTRIQVSNLAIIEALEMSFADGFNIITGETGAGKSILIKALGLVFGARADADVVRAGAASATVCATFQLKSEHRVIQILRQRGVLDETFHKHVEVLIRRQISAATARSQAWINDIPVSMQLLKELSCFFIDIFSQHENHRLLSVSEHVHILDEFLKEAELPERFSTHYRQVQSSAKEFVNFCTEALSQNRDLDYLQFRLERYREFNPNSTDYEKVLQQTRLAKDYLKLTSAVQKACELLDQSEGTGVARAVKMAALSLGEFTDQHPILSSIKQSLEQAIPLLDDATYELSKFSSSIQIDEADIEAAETRLAGYQDLMRKFAVESIEELIMAGEQLEERLLLMGQLTETLDQRLSQLQADIHALHAEAKQLSIARREAAKRLEDSVVKELKDLHMAQTRLHVDFQEILRPSAFVEPPLPTPELLGRWLELSADLASLCERGSESVQFLLSAGPKEALLPLQKIASGGEVSRIMLALKKALSVGADCCLMVFDEIDTGISGKVADVVGKKLRDLAKSFQVLCISHLPQVAAYADAHFLVEKKSAKGRSESSIVPLSEVDSLRELARLLSGDEVTKQSLANAREMRERVSIRSASSP